jgi:ribokinase
MYDIITIGSSLIDTFIHSEEFKVRSSREGVYLCQSYGDKIDVDSYEVRTGGGASNTAVGFARMGFRVGVVSELGRDVLAQVIEEEFHRERVATNLLIKERKEQTGGSVILVGKDGGRTALVHRGASSLLDPHDLPLSAVDRSDWVHLASISGRLSTLRELFSALSEGRRRLSWNPGKDELRLLGEGLLPVSDIPCEVLLLNRQEWSLLGAVQQALEAQVRVIVVTDGKVGGRYFARQSGWHEYETQEVESIDDTGAGDAFAVGFVSALRAGEDAGEAIRWGAHNARSVVQQIGAKPGLLTRQQLMEVMQ